MGEEASLSFYSEPTNICVKPRGGDDMTYIATIAARLDAAARDARAIPQITGQEGELPLSDAYDIQRAVIDHRPRAARLWSG